MKMLRILGCFLMAAVIFFPVSSQAVSVKADTSISSIQDAQAKLNDLNNQVEEAQGRVDNLNRQLTTDRQQQAVIDSQVSQLARLQYEQPTMSISMVMGALTLDQLLGDIAQSRLVAHKQADLLSQARRVADAVQRNRDQQEKQLDTIKSARDKAAQMIEKVMGYSPLVDQARATAGFPAPYNLGPFKNTFAYGYCTYYVASRRNVPWSGNAADWWANAREYGFPEGETPKPGSIAVFGNAPYGHVAYVESVNPDGSYLVSEMNYSGWNRVDSRQVPPHASYLMGFIY